MISQYFEQKILEGTAKNRVLNLSNAVNNYAVGRAKTVIVNKIHVQPIISTFYTLTTQDPAEVEAAIKAIYLNASIFTLSIYSENDTYNVTFKNVINTNVTAFTGSGGGFIVTANSTLNFEENVFFKLTGENVTFEISEIGSSFNGVGQTTGSANFNSKQGNPQGFNDPVILSNNGVNVATKPLGQQTAATPGQANFYDFIVPKIGNGVTGNKLNDVTGVNANITLPIININLIELI
jgi:hypothetical protein